MGQANLRGTYEERLKLGVEKRLLAEEALRQKKVERNNKELDRLAAMTPIEKSKYKYNKALIESVLASLEMYR